MAADPLGDKNIWEAARIEQLCAHYQHTNELVHRLWERRNFQFVILAGVIALSVIIALLHQGLQTILADILAGILPVDGAAKVTISSKIAPFMPHALEAIAAFLTVSVFYLTSNLYHRSTHISNYYRYLATLETEIRQTMKLPPGSLAFTREGDYFLRTGEHMSRRIGASYKFVLLVLLLAFFLLRIAIDGFRAYYGWLEVAPGSLTDLFGPNSPLTVKFIVPNILVIFNFVMFLLTMRMYGGYAKWWWVNREATDAGYT